MPKLSKAGAEKEARTLEAIADIQALGDTPFRWADIARRIQSTRLHCGGDTEAVRPKSVA
jgi:hypothetical protein